MTDFKTEWVEIFRGDLRMRKEWTPADSEALLKRAKAIVLDSKKNNPDQPLTYAQARKIALSEAVEVKPTLVFCEPINLEFAERAKTIVLDSKKNNPDQPLTYAQARKIALSEGTDVKPTLAFCEPINLEFAERAKAIVRDSKKNNPDRPLTYAEAREIARAG